MYPHAQCWHSLLYCALHASACFRPGNLQPFTMQYVICTHMLNVDTPCFIVPSTLLHASVLETHNPSFTKQYVIHITYCVTYHILCYIPLTVLHITYCVTYHILCYISHTVLHITYCATYHILCYIPHTVLNTYHILCYIPHNVLHTTYCATYHILYVSTCLILTVLALSCTPRFRMFVCW